MTNCDKEYNTTGIDDNSIRGTVLAILTPILAINVAFLVAQV